MTAPTSIRLPVAPLVEVEFTPGVWTDVTADVDQQIGTMEIRFGRSSEFSPPQPAEFGVTLRNFTQQYTPQNAASPYYPNVVRRKRIRYSYNPAGTQRFRYVGYVKQWQPLLVDGLPYMVINAKCRLDQFSRLKMLSPIRQEITRDLPMLWWPLTDDSGSVSAAEQSGNSGPALGIAGLAPAPAFGSDGPGFGDGPGVQFAASSYLTAGTMQIPQTFTAELWFNIPAAPSGAVGMLTLDQPQVGGGGGSPITIGLNTSRNITLTADAGTATSTAVASINGWHQIILTRSWTPSTASYTVYLDGSSVAIATLTGAAPLTNWRTVTVGQTAAGAATGPFAGNIGQVAIYNAVLTPSRVVQHGAAGNGYAGDDVSLRIGRWLGYTGAGVSGTSSVIVGTYPQAGRDVLSACQDMAVTEGGGAVFYTGPDGSLTFVNRRYRDNRTPKLTIDAVADLDPSVYQPSLDDSTLVTSVTADRASESGTQTSQTYSSGAADVFAEGVTTYTTSDGDAIALAQYIVNSQSEDALRFPQIAVDLMKAGHDLYDAVGQLRIGDRIRVTNIPTVAYPISQLDFFLEGWAETPGLDSYMFVMDISAADVPGPRFQLDVSHLDSADVLAL